LQGAQIGAGGLSPPVPPHFNHCSSERDNVIVNTHRRRRRHFVFITSAEEFTFSSSFVCLLAGLCKNYSVGLRKFGGKAACGPWKKPFDSGSNVRVTNGSPGDSGPPPRSTTEHNIY